MIFIISICKEKLHYYEFVKPIEDVLNEIGKKYFVRHYSEVSEKDLKKCEKVIICGTSLKDNEFVKRFCEFDWLLNFKRPVLGICGGMQIIGLVFGGVLKKESEENKSFLKKKTEIGFYTEKFNKEFLGLNGEVEVYHLHNNFIDFRELKDFEIFSESRAGINRISQAVRLKGREIYGVLFHPEVRQKELIKRFVED